jgi:cytochrome b561
MQLRNSAHGYGGVAKILHWTTVGLVLICWLLGTFGDDLPRGTVRSAGLFIHISAGLAILVLLFIRLFWRMVNPPPPAERTPLGSWVEIAGRLTHIALYVLLAATPIMGVLLQFARGDALPVFGVLDITSPWVRDRAFASSVKEVHEVLANILLILAAFHALAALVHHWVWRDRTLARMLPGIAR